MNFNWLAVSWSSLRAKRGNPVFRLLKNMDCFATLAMTVLALFSILLHADQSLFKLETAALGKSQKISLKVIALAPAKINKSAPIRITLESGEKVQVATLSESEATFDLDSLKGSLLFHLCTAKWCRKIEQDLTQLSTSDPLFKSET